MERRAHPRTSVGCRGRVANVSEAAPAEVEVIDISIGGALMAYAEPVGLLVGERVVVSLTMHRSPVMLLGHVVRIAHGADFRTYVAVEFSANQDIEVEQLEHEIAHRRCAPT